MIKFAKKLPFTNKSCDPHVIKAAKKNWRLKGKSTKTTTDDKLGGSCSTLRWGIKWDNNSSGAKFESNPISSFCFLDWKDVAGK